MRKILSALYEHQYLSREKARDVLVNIGEGLYNDCMIASLLSVYLMRSITIEELTGFRDALLEMCIRVDLSDYDPVDIVGTGGDNKNTFNISTLSCLVLAGAGYIVAKHGNYGSSSVSGASNVLEQYGVKFTNNPDQLRRCIEKSNFCFMHAPLFNPVMKAVAPVRKALGVRTFFNLLGPLVNPSFPRHQVLGVYNLKMARLYNYMYQAQKDVNYSIVYSLDGYDEVSLTSDFKWISNDHEELLSPEMLGFPTHSQIELFAGNTPAEAAVIFDHVLHGIATPAQMNTVVANSAVSIKTIRREKSIENCLAEAHDSLYEGKALMAFNKFVQVTNSK